MRTVNHFKMLTKMGKLSMPDNRPVGLAREFPQVDASLPQVEPEVTPNPAPYVASLDVVKAPENKDLDEEKEVLIIGGMGFVPESTVTIEGNVFEVHYIDPECLKVRVRFDPGAYTVTVNNPAPGGGHASAIYLVNKPLNLDFSYNGLSQAKVDSLLMTLSTLGIKNGRVDLGGTNAAPSDTGKQYRSLLEDSGWDIVTN